MTFTLFSNRKNQINNAITSIQDQIAQLQQQLADQQAFLQELGTVEQAGESAINQARTFLTMVRVIDPSQEEIFWQAMDALKGEDAAAIAPSPEEDSKAETPEPSDKPVDGAVIDVASTEVVEDVVETPEESTEPQEDEPTSNGNGKVYLSEKDLSELTIQTIRKLASNKKVDSKGKRWEIAYRLVGLVTQEDVNALN